MGAYLRVSAYSRVGAYSRGCLFNDFQIRCALLQAGCLFEGPFFRGLTAISQKVDAPSIER